MVKIATKEGPLTFWRGFMPIWSRFAPTTTLQLVMFEQLRGMMGMKSLWRPRSELLGKSWEPSGVDSCQSGLDSHLQQLFNSLCSNNCVVRWVWSHYEDLEVNCWLNRETHVLDNAIFKDINAILLLDRISSNKHCNCFLTMQSFVGGVFRNYRFTKENSFRQTYFNLMELLLSKWKQKLVSEFSSCVVVADWPRMTVHSSRSSTVRAILRASWRNQIHHESREPNNSIDRATKQSLSQTLPKHSFFTVQSFDNRSQTLPENSLFIVQSFDNRKNGSKRTWSCLDVIPWNS
jgi:hypothetical protein